MVIVQPLIMVAMEYLILTNRAITPVLLSRQKLVGLCGERKV
jgi:hypothetical protein